MAEPICLACGAVNVVPWAVAHDVEYLSTPHSYGYVRCEECGALSIAHVPRDRLSEIYPETYYSFSEQRLGLAERVKEWLDRRMFKKLFAQMKGERLSALDVGGGTGWLLAQAREIEPRLKHTAVVDIDAQARQDAEKRGHAFHLSRIETFESERKYDLILLLNLIEHVEDPVAVLAKMRNLLAPGGKILAKTPNHDSFDARIFRHYSWGGYHCPRHWVIFTPESFARAAGRAGLVLDAVELTQGAPFWAVSALEWLRRGGLVNIRRDRPMCRHPLFGPLLVIFAAVDIARRPFARTSQMFAQLSSS
ncbi:MAG TPA: class I SAM-dependent methyltransferase [Sphingomicrobium sp.]